MGNDRESETSHEFGLVASTRGPLVLVRHTKSGFDDDNNINAYFFSFFAAELPEHCNVLQPQGYTQTCEKCQVSGGETQGQLHPTAESLSVTP